MNNATIRHNSLALLLALAASPWALAQSADPSAHAAHPAEAAAPAASAAAAPQLLSEGEVRRINRDAGKVTLRHGPLTNLDMPAMTMVFTAVDPRMLDGLKEGDKVRFTADKKDGAFVITAIQAAK